MKTSKSFLRSLEALGLAAVLALGVVALLPAQDATASGLCSPYGVRTVNAWGAGATCAAARTSCSANAWNAAETYCGARDVCEAQAVQFHQANCYFESGMYKVDCHLDFKCTLPGLPGGF